MATAERGALRWRGTIRPWQPAASALRARAPRLWGSSMPSRARKKGGSRPARGVARSSVRSMGWMGATTARTPWWAPLRASASISERGTVWTSTPRRWARSRRSPRAARPTPEASRIRSMGRPARRASTIGRRPSIRVRPWPGRTASLAASSWPRRRDCLAWRAPGGWRGASRTGPGGGGPLPRRRAARPGWGGAGRRGAAGSLAGAAFLAAAA